MVIETRIDIFRFITQVNKFILPLGSILFITGVINLIVGEPVLGLGRGTQGIGLIDPLSITITGLFVLVSGLTYIYSDLVLDDKDKMLSAVVLIRKAFFRVIFGVSFFSIVVVRYMFDLEFVYDLLVAVLSGFYITPLLVFILSFHKVRLKRIYNFFIEDYTVKHSLSSSSELHEKDGSIEERLEKLNSLYDKGLITNEELEEKRKKLIDSL